MKKEIDEPIIIGQIWQHALGDKVIIHGTGKMRIGSQGEAEENGIASVVYAVYHVRGTKIKGGKLSPILFTRDEETFRQRFHHIE